jgi:hypothetical protein
LERATYLASVVDNVIIVCLLDLQVVTLFPVKNM